MARKKPTKRAKLIADQAVNLAEYAAKALVAAEQLRVKTKAVERFPLDEGERATVAAQPSVAAKLKKKLAKQDGSFTVAEVAGMVMAAAESFIDAEPPQQVALLLVAKKLTDCLQAGIAMPTTRPIRATRSRKAKPADTVYQFKISLLESHPPIWRRIQVKDGTLDKLHEHIQTAMGWTNSHLHHFKIGEQRYGDPMLLHENFTDLDYEDSTSTKISAILPKSGKRSQFEYEYDFGDSWHHDILFEGCIRAEQGGRYPVCVEGSRACPPEDVGGVWGYAEFLNAMADPDHERHYEFSGWIGGSFDSEAFEAAAATKRMRRGLPDWRSQQWI
jgi:hypothetical protein